MISFILIAVWSLVWSACAAPQPQSGVQANVTATSTLSATFTLSWTSTLVTTLSTSTTTSITYLPTYTATELRVIKPGSEIHLLPLNAHGLTFQLGGNPSAYCPAEVEDEGATCPSGNITGVNGCSMSTEVPGGQQIYLSTDGSLRYTQAHSIHMPSGSVQCPLSYTPVRGTVDAMEVSIDGFKATGFMACPELPDYSRAPQQWMVYANTTNATTPLGGNISTCTPFEVAGLVVQLGHAPAAWQYL